jgi:DNA-binding MarR family transcriptional regulator
MIPGSLNNDLYFNLDRASLLMRRQVLEVLNEYEVSPEQWEILQYLDEQNGISQSKLTRVTLKDKGNVSRIVARMVRDGWVERRSSSVDSRTVLLFLTPKGAKIRDRVPAQLHRQTDTLLIPLDNNERGELLQTLKKLRVLLGDNNVVDS